jgi:hypothetical protein
MTVVIPVHLGLETAEVDATATLLSVALRLLYLADEA